MGREKRVKNEERKKKELKRMWKRREKRGSGGRLLQRD
jgi:hypothetical protein